VGSIEIMTSRMVEQMRQACALAAELLCEVGKQLRPGMTTDEINTFVHEFTASRHARSAPLNYRGFPKSVCTSVNEVVCHGIPGPRVLRAGDIVNVDVTPYYPIKDGYYGDTSATFYVGEPSEDAKRVVEVSRQCLELGIAEVRDGARLGDIGAAIQEHAEAQGCSVVRDFVGHGIGRQFHMPPQVCHFGTRGTGKRLKAGMVFTIEPMINLGDWRVEVLDDGWTAVTADGSLSAQFEHTVLVTKEGCEVLTARNEVLVGSEDVPWARLGRRSAPAAFGARPAPSSQSGSAYAG
jgi:methionyl aminopeptidase